MASAFENFQMLSGTDLTDIADLLSKAKDYLGQIQGSVESADFSMLAELGKILAEGLRKNLEDVTIDVTAERNKPREDIPKNRRQCTARTLIGNI